MLAAVLLVLVAVFGPVAFLLHFVYVRDRYEREPKRLVLRVYLFSLLTPIPALILEVGLLGATAQMPVALRLLVIAVGVGLIEEGVKLAFVIWRAYENPAFNEPYDGIVYAVAVSLGFATVEGLLYDAGFLAAGASSAAVVLIGVRAVLAIPGHALWGVVMGAYLGRAKFAEGDKRRRLQRAAWLVPAGLHAAYDFCAFSAAIAGSSGRPVLAGVFVIGFLAVIVASWPLALRLIHQAQRASPFRPQPA